MFPPAKRYSGLGWAARASRKIVRLLLSTTAVPVSTQVGIGNHAQKPGDGAVYLEIFAMYAENGSIEICFNAPGAGGALKSVRSVVAFAEGSPCGVRSKVTV
jgi:hypothetical protein